jgi:glutathione synthase/RimK-type ligase-like ATP-grasp enzyme
MKRYDITIVTAQRYLHPSDPDWYVKQILQEDELLTSALRRNGLTVHRIDWTNRDFDWSSTRSVIFRSTWDYTERFDEFLQFVRSLLTRTLVINPVSIILWNLDKHYLRDLHVRGVQIPETIYIEKNSDVDLRTLVEFHRFGESILKPAMSAGARHTYRLNDGNLREHEALFQRLIKEEAMMLQPFLPSVMTDGEKTLVVIGGRFTHAVIKKAKAGDFRVQDDFGGTVHHYSPTPEEILFAEHAVSVCDPLPFYARVDILTAANGTPVVSELEMIEPELWFRFHPEAADRLAEMIERELKRTKN